MHRTGLKSAGSRVKRSLKKETITKTRKTGYGLPLLQTEIKKWTTTHGTEMNRRCVHIDLRTERHLAHSKLPSSCLKMNSIKASQVWLRITWKKIPEWGSWSKIHNLRNKNYFKKTIFILLSNKRNLKDEKDEKDENNRTASIDCSSIKVICSKRNTCAFQFAFRWVIIHHVFVNWQQREESDAIGDLSWACTESWEPEE